MFYIKSTTFYFFLFVTFFVSPAISLQNIDPPAIDSVSVNKDGHVKIGWTAQIDNATEGYFEILRDKKDNGPDYDSIGTTDLETTYYIDTNIDASESQQSYCIRAIIKNNEKVTTPLSDAHHTIFTESLNYDICKEKLIIKWSNYAIDSIHHGSATPKPVPFDSTMILKSSDGKNFEIKETVAIEQNNIKLPIKKSGKYFFKIRSFKINDTITSTSNIKAITITETSLKPPDFAHLIKASVINNEFIRLNLYADSTISEPSYVIQKAENQPSDFNPVDTINSYKANILYKDTDAGFLNSKNYYYYEVLDSCKRSVKKSDTVSSIYLKAEPISNKENKLTWNEPRGLSAEVGYYVIKRKKQKDSDFEVIEPAIPPGQTSYNDYFAKYGEEKFFEPLIYKVKAIGTFNYFHKPQLTIYSNYAKVERELETFIPNAFNPESNIEENRVFKPIIRNVIPKKYRMTIYNNWGNIVFQTNDHKEPWDGNINGNKAPPGVYRYSVAFRTKYGQEHREKGTVKLIR